MGTKISNNPFSCKFFSKNLAIFRKTTYICGIHFEHLKQKPILIWASLFCIKAISGRIQIAEEGQVLGVE